MAKENRVTKGVAPAGQIMSINVDDWTVLKLEEGHFRNQFCAAAIVKVMNTLPAETLDSFRDLAKAAQASLSGQ